MNYITEAILRDYAEKISVKCRIFSNIKTSRASALSTIFLSHSHLDKELALGLVGYFESLGISLYVDWNDGDMPRIANRETADKIKQKIASNSLFMVLATKNALNSKWVPWEVGVADQMKHFSRILVIPVSDSYGRYEGSEYLQLYQQIGNAYNYLLEAATYEKISSAKELSSLKDYIKIYGS
jgi:hypothetical protein